MNSAANGTPAFAVHDAIALDGDKLKPREDQRKGGNGFGINEEGAGYTLTGVDRHGVAYGIDQQGGKGGNNLPLVCFSKVSHPSAPNGEGERWDKREVAQTRNTFDNGEKRCQEVVVSTAYKLDSTASNSMKSANPHSGFHETQVAACLDTTTPDPSKGQSGNVIISTNSNGEDVAPTLNTSMAKLGGDNQTTFGGGMS